MATMVRERRGAVALVEGEAGAGKTALLQATLGALPADVSVLSGRCEPLAIPAPFSALYETLRALPPDIAAAIRAAGDVLGVSAAVLDLMQQQPIVLLLDDLQWADAATAGLARYLGRRLAGTPSTLVCAYRGDELNNARDAAGAIAALSRVSVRVDLPPLSVDGVRELAAALAPDRVDGAPAIHRATGGNPLFVTEALRSPGGTVPGSVGEIVVAQVRRLPIAVQNLVETISVCPDGMQLDAALALSVDAGRHIDLACERRVLTVERGRVQCRHDLLRAGIDAAIPPVRRRQLHQRVVAVLEPRASGTPDLARLAYHCAEAGAPRQAVEYSLAAADAAIATGAHRDAASHLTRALAFRDEMTTEELERTLALMADTQRATSTAHPSGLTGRQLDVLGLLVAGRTNAEIAVELYISEKTAGHHVSAILARLGATSRREAARLATARGWA